jgi:hypothetical protein
MAGLTSHLGGFTNHEHRHTTSTQLLGKVGERRLILAKPTYIQSTHQTLWDIIPELALLPLTGLPLADQHMYRERFEQVKYDILARLEEAEGHRAMKDMHNALVIPNLSSVFVNRSAAPNAPEFVVVNWGCLEDGRDPPPPPRGLVNVRIRVTSAHSGIPLAGKRILVAIGGATNEEVPYFTDDFGEVALGRKEKGALVFIRKSQGKEPTKQSQYEVGSEDPSVLDFPWEQTAYLRLLLPPSNVRSADLDELLWESSQGNRSPLKLTQDEELLVKGLSADDEVRLFSLSKNGERELRSCVCVEGENVIDLKAFRVDEPDSIQPEEPKGPSPGDSGPVPPDSGRMRVVWNNFLRRPIASLNYGLHSTSEERELNRTTDEAGIDEVKELPFGNHHLYTRWKGQDWLIPIQHERGVEEHVIQLRRHWPWWIFILAGAILLLAVFMFWRVPYQPEVRLVDAATLAPIPSGSVEYQNFDGQIVEATAGDDGMVQLNMGERPLYKKVFQLNPETPATARAAGYQDNPSSLHYRTWYWTLDWPLAPINEEEVPVVPEDSLGLPVEGIVEDVSRVLSTGDRPWENCRPQRAVCKGRDCIEIEVCSVEPSIILIKRGGVVVSHFAVLNGESYTETLARGDYEVYQLSGYGWNFASSPPVPKEPDGCELRGYFNDGDEVSQLEESMTNSMRFCLGGCGTCSDPIDEKPATIRDVLR